MVERRFCKPLIRIRFPGGAQTRSTSTICNYLTSDIIRFYYYLMPYNFYLEKEYRERQSKLTKESWQRGEHDLLIKPLETRHCKNPDCKILFKVKPYEDKIFCSKKCSAHTNNPGRKLSEATKKKILSS